MYRINVNVNLTPMGASLLKTENFATLMNIADREIAENITVNKNKLIEMFSESIMPKSLFYENTFNAELLGYDVKDGDWMMLKTNLNSYTTVYIPVEVDLSYNDIEAGDHFHVKPIEGYDYSHVEEDLISSSYTNHSFTNMKCITVRTFSIASMKIINGSKRIDATAIPMTQSEIENVKESIRYKTVFNKIHKNLEKIEDYIPIMELQDIANLNDILENTIKEIENDIM